MYLYYLNMFWTITDMLLIGGNLFLIVRKMPVICASKHRHLLKIRDIFFIIII